MTPPTDTNELPAPNVTAKITLAPPTAKHIAAPSRFGDCRKPLSPAQRHLWLALNNNQVGASFRRQAIILGLTADFYSRDLHLVIHVDGAYHNSTRQQNVDKRRDIALANLGLSTVRFSNEDVFLRLPSVIAVIKNFTRPPVVVP